MKKEEELIASFIWCGAVVQVYIQTVTFAGTVIQRHLLPKNLRQAVDKAAQAECLAVDSPRHVQQNRRRVRNEEQQHYGVTARAMQRRIRSGG
ncbi:hypothetical protein [Klebsiella pneumoniae]|uniref:hypothetical protein n=1 Tax=Klebsiella pneumoniae TaxID=573 RepID=UPI000DEAF4E9|nr:hypothetical protein [Klebsiella pneumoniae]RBZ92149.1 hypothetical protein DM067_04115 [Klebsiella pneumoniae]